MIWPEEVLNTTPWKGSRPPRRILAIRLEALGDTIITLPWLASLREQYPAVRIDFLVLEKNAELPRKLKIFNRVVGLRGRIARLQFLYANLMLPLLILNRYDVVIDLQRNTISRWVRFWIFPKSWSEIERFSISLAGEKFRRGIEAVGFKGIEVPASIPLKDDRGREILQRSGWNGSDPLIVLNPAGAFITRHWPLLNYVAFARLWTRQISPNAKYLLLGNERIQESAHEILTNLGQEGVINLVGALTISESFSVLAQAQLIVTEDSGLMHMAWVQRIPTLALFGSSPSYWSAPMGSWTKCLSSSDLPCGNCLSESCRFGDVHCLTRYSPEHIVTVAQNLLRVTHV